MGFWGAGLPDWGLPCWGLLAMVLASVVRRLGGGGGSATAAISGVATGGGGGGGWSSSVPIRFLALFGERTGALAFFDERTVEGVSDMFRN